MLRALRVVMIIYGVILVLGGIAGMVIPDQVAKLADVEEIDGYTKSIIITLGAIRLASGVWVIAASRDLLHNIYWVKFGITEGFLLVAVGVYSIIRGYIEFNQGGPLFILAAVITVALLIFYPWRAGRTT